jgi:AraC-like DNA-binding protein
MTTQPGFADQLVEVRNPVPLRISRFHTTNSADIRQFFLTAYAGGWQLNGFTRGTSVTVRRQAVHGITIDEFVVSGAIRFEVRTGRSVVVIRPRAGSLSLAGDTINGTNPFLLNADTLPCTLEANPAQFHVVSIDKNVLHEVAAEDNPSLPHRIHFVCSRPPSRTIALAWLRALDDVIAGFNYIDAARRPLTVRAATRLLTAATLESFPSNVAAEQDPPAALAVPKAFRDAVAYIHNHADRGIGINDVAVAVRLTPRAVQYLFRQQADMTPSEYLRRVRLQRARVDLVSGDRSTTTVSAVAQKWGFAHTGRFSVQYREAYGESPHITLRT